MQIDSLYFRKTNYVLEKKISLQDSIFNEQDLKGWKIVQFTSQFDQLVSTSSSTLMVGFMLKLSKTV